ncbi:ketopantoate reductase family protein [Pseudonocardia aurantiaca]|uniref:2-dehydropantoate 2-reductase n=1 Tax=Pseudonocardia aurantiaca TaxID=75290 RepID=A0ABW4FJ08_9PSEU
MKILVVGAGATGGWYGARLAAAGRDVTFLVRAGRVAVLRERGLRLTGADDEVITPRTVTAAELDGPYDVVLVAVKALALEQATEDFAPAVGPDTMVVPFLNGMAHVDTLTARFGDRVLGGVIRIATTVGQDGEIVRLAPFADLTVGELDGSDSPRVKKLVAQLAAAGFDVVQSPAIVADLWNKWVFIATVGALNCLARGTVGEIVAEPGGTELGPALLAEAAAVAAAGGYPLPDAELANTAAMTTRVGSSFASSMYRDVVAGLPTEVEPILGDLVARARELRVPVPLLDVATLQLRVHQRRVEHRAHGASTT